MLIMFKLSMPNVGSWNGRWSGEEKLYAIVKSFSNKSDIANEILEKGYYHYNFGDGWSAGISISIVSPNEARKIRKKSSGFCGYEWMVDSILKHGKIITGKEEYYNVV